MGSGNSTSLKKLEEAGEAAESASGKAEDVERALKDLERFVLAKIEFHQQKADQLEKRFEEFMRVSEEKVNRMEKNTQTLEERMVRNLEKVDFQLQEMEGKTKAFEDSIQASRDASQALADRMNITLCKVESRLQRANIELSQLEKDNQDKYDQITRYLESVAAVGEVFTYAGRALSLLSKAMFCVFYFPWWIILMVMRWREHRKTEVCITSLTQGVVVRGNGRYRFWSYHHGNPSFKHVNDDLFLYFVRSNGWHLSENLGSTESWAQSASKDQFASEQLEAIDTWTCCGEEIDDLVSVRRPCCSDAVVQPVFWWLGATNAVVLALCLHAFVNPEVETELLPLEVPFAVWSLSIALLVSVGTLRGCCDTTQRDDVYKRVLAIFGENTEVNMHFDESMMFIFGLLPALMSSFLTYYFTRELTKSIDCNPDYSSETDRVAYCMPVSAGLGLAHQQEICCRVIEEARFTLSTFIAIFVSNTQAGYIGVKYAMRMAIAAQKQDGKAEDSLTRLRSRHGVRKVLPAPMSSVLATAQRS